MPCKFTNPKIQLLDDNAVTYLMFLSFEICIMGSVLIIGPPQNARALESFLLMVNCFPVL